MPAIDIDKIKAALGRLKSNPTDVLALDVGSSATKAVRVRKSGDGVAFVAADILPTTALPKGAEKGETAVAALELPKELAAKHASFAVPGENAVVKLLSFPSRGEDAEAEIEGKIVESVGVEEPDDYRISYKIVSLGQGRAESRALAVAIFDSQASAACDLIPVGLPAPYSVELSGLAAMTAFQYGPGDAHSGEAVGLVEFGARVSFFVIFSKGSPVLIRKFDFGTDLILEEVQKSLGIDRATAEGILADGSFDVSQQISEVMDSFVKQVIVSRDFVERRENSRVEKVYASGGATVSRDWLLEMKSALGFDVALWNPFEALDDVPDPFPEHLQGQEARFAAAVGVGMATILGDKEQ